MKTALLACLGAAALALSACDSAGPRGGQTSATPAEDPANPWATYANPDWDHESSAVNKTESGLEYIVLAAGEPCEGGPEGGDQAFVHYEGRLTDGTIFDSSLARGVGINFPANRVIPGWTEALGLMCPGDDWLVYLPSEIAYGETPRPGGPIKPGDDLIFRMILMAQISEEDWSGATFK
ncbi:MAG: peptidylprolyl isomerase [Ponticaulis sp.]|nr:peptidylprolyl isomerase [Ponticaulis sp.]